MYFVCELSYLENTGASDDEGCHGNKSHHIEMKKNQIASIPEGSWTYSACLTDLASYEVQSGVNDPFMRNFPVGNGYNTGDIMENVAPRPCIHYFTIKGVKIVVLAEYFCSHNGVFSHLPITYNVDTAGKGRTVINSGSLEGPVIVLAEDFPIVRMSLKQRKSLITMTV